ncbi:MAG TPA: ComF family protein [Caulobacteraceae bacterium]
MLADAKALCRQSLRGVQDLILPHHAFDGSGRTATSGLSAQAWSKIQFIADPVCDSCSLPFDYDLGPGVRCPACEARPRAFARARAACLYDEHSRDLILQFKHADRLDLARLFSLWLSRSAEELIAGADAIAPVPMHPFRLIRRRYNQAAEIARPLARQAGVAYWPGVLKRKRAGESQAGKSGSGRRRNVQGAYVCPAGWEKRIAGKRILLVDDVMTTGATVEACAKALTRAGASAVDVAVIARVRETETVSI